MVEGLSIGARKQVMVSEPRRGLSPWVLINHQQSWLVIALFLSSLKIMEPEPATGQKLTVE